MFGEREKERERKREEEREDREREKKREGQRRKKLNYVNKKKGLIYTLSEYNLHNEFKIDNT